jgi:hypothetical protein
VKGLNLSLLNDTLAVMRLDPEADFPAAWLPGCELLAMVRTAEELSIVCREDLVPSGSAVETGWRAIKVEGPLDFSLVGVLAALAAPLAQAGVSIFAISTFNTDYILVKQTHLEAAIQALAAAGHNFTRK